MNLIKELAFPLAVMFIFLLVVVAAFQAIDRFSCREYTAATERATEYRFWSGCYVQHDDRLIPKDEYKFVELKEH